MLNRYYLLLLLVVFTITATAQTTEKFFDWEWRPCEPAAARFYSAIMKTDSGFVRQDYFVHERTLQMTGKFKDADCKIANGHFFYFYPNGDLESNGQYINGKKEGAWLKYHSNGNMSDSSVYEAGNVVGVSLSWHASGYPSDSVFYKPDRSGVHVAWFDDGTPSYGGMFTANGKRHGKWTYFHKNGKLSAVENYSVGIQLESSYFDETGAALVNALDDKDASFGKSANSWSNYVYKNIYFPNNFKFVNADKAVVVVSFEIDEAGNVVNPFVSTPFYPDFDKIALTAIKRSPAWKPAISHNRKVRTRFRQIVTFSQE